MSTIIGLGDLAEDELIGKPMPIEVNCTLCIWSSLNIFILFHVEQILLENLQLHLVEDRPPVNITSPGSVPIDLSIGKMRVTRDDAGRFQIQPHEETECHENAQTTTETTGGQKKERDRELLSLQLVMQQLKMDNEQLKKQLRITEKSSETIK